MSVSFESFIYHFLGRLKKIQDKKRIARKKAEAILEKMKAEGVDIHGNSMLDEGDEDLLF